MSTYITTVDITVFFSPQKILFGQNISWHSLTLPVTFDRCNIRCSYFVFILHRSATSIWHLHWLASDLDFHPRWPCLGLCVSQTNLGSWLFCFFSEVSTEPESWHFCRISYYTPYTRCNHDMETSNQTICLKKNCIFELNLWKFM